jgi:hypothetical protein
MLFTAPYLLIVVVVAAVGASRALVVKARHRVPVQTALLVVSTFKGKVKVNINYQASPNPQ